MKVLADGSFAIDDRIDIPGEGDSYFTFATGWLLELVEIESGEYYFISDGAEIKPGCNRFGVFYPPFTLIRCYVKDVRGSVRGIGASGTIADLPLGPVLFETEAGELTDIASAAGLLRRTNQFHRTIEINTLPSLTSLRAKRLIDENYLVYPSISRIAARLSVSAEHLSRQFKRDYGLSPSAYLHQLRVAEATFRLSLGEEIIDISHEVGYNDLSRFYKQFRKNTRTSPGACRSILKK